MASTVTDLTFRAFATNSYDALSTSIGLLAILTLVVLLVAREAMQATGTPDLVTRVRPLTALSVPLLAPWVLVTAVRLISLL